MTSFPVGKTTVVYKNNNNKNAMTAFSSDMDVPKYAGIGL
jgi:hypothetical protein